MPYIFPNILPVVSLLTLSPGEMDVVDEWVAMLLTEGEVVGSTSNSSIVLKFFTW